MKAVITYFREAREELMKVIWPTTDELKRHTVIVIVVSLFVAAFLGVLDVIFRAGLQNLI